MQSKSRIGRPLKKLELTDEEREKREMIARRPKTAQRMRLAGPRHPAIGIWQIKLDRMRATRVQYADGGQMARAIPGPSAGVARG